jgi:hypothetical protein
MRWRNIFTFLQLTLLDVVYFDVLFSYCTPTVYWSYKLSILRHTRKRRKKCENLQFPARPRRIVLPTTTPVPTWKERRIYHCHLWANFRTTSFRTLVIAREDETVKDTHAPSTPLWLQQIQYCPSIVTIWESIADEFKFKYSSQYRQSNNIWTGHSCSYRSMPCPC